MGEQHLDLLAAMPRPFVFGCLGESASHVPGLFIQVAGDLPEGHVRAALRLQFARSAVALARAIKPGARARDTRPWHGVAASELHQLFASRTRILVRLS